jgi:hypothetical protein
VLDGPVLANFEKEREHIESIMARSAPRVAQSQQQSAR